MSGAPLPLLGTFHEISIAADDVPAAVGFYERLGFTKRAQLHYLVLRQQKAQRPSCVP